MFHNLALQTSRNHNPGKIFHRKTLKTYKNGMNWLIFLDLSYNPCKNFKFYSCQWQNVQFFLIFTNNQGKIFLILPITRGHMYTCLHWELPPPPPRTERGTSILLPKQVSGFVHKMSSQTILKRIILWYEKGNIFPLFSQGVTESSTKRQNFFTDTSTLQNLRKMLLNRGGVSFCFFYYSWSEWAVF